MTNASALDGFRRICSSRIESVLDRCLPAISVSPSRLHEAMRYASLGGGKRVRAMLCYAAAQSLGASAQRADVVAASVELIHAYSLVHDDLPAMDDDDLRRGRPACHREFDEATAILAGDGLQTLAFHVLTHDPALDVSAQTKLRMIEALAMASGSRGMVGGQALDLDAVGQRLELAQLENMHIHKTGALIRAAVQLGAWCADAPDTKQVQRLDHYAKCLGLAFQVQDDILDEVGNSQQLGKTSGKDRAGGKPTYTSLLGLADARTKARDLISEALLSLDGFDVSADPLRWLGEYVVARDY